GRAALVGRAARGVDFAGGRGVRGGGRPVFRDVASSRSAGALSMTFTDRDLEALARRLGAALRARPWTFAAAESCTGGWIAKAVTDVPGSSHWFVAGYVVYANDAKSRMLDVPPATIDEHGAVSEAVVVALAENARRDSAASLTVAVSGVAG